MYIVVYVQARGTLTHQQLVAEVLSAIAVFRPDPKVPTFYSQVTFRILILLVFFYYLAGDQAAYRVAHRPGIHAARRRHPELLQVPGVKECACIHHM